MTSKTSISPPPPGRFYRTMMSFMGLFDRGLHFSCKSFIQVASQKYDRPLGKKERMRQAMHRAMCRICRTQEQRMDQLHALAADVGRTDVDDVQVVMDEQTSSRIRAAMVKAANRP